MANIHDSDDDSDDDSFDEQQGGINFYPELNNIHDIRDNIGGEEEDNIGDNIRDNIHDNNIPPAGGGETVETFFHYGCGTTPGVQPRTIVRKL